MTARPCTHTLTHSRSLELPPKGDGVLLAPNAGLPPPNPNPPAAGAAAPGAPKPPAAAPAGAAGAGAAAAFFTPAW